MLYGRVRSLVFGLAVAACMGTADAHAADLNIVAVGDSITNGFGFSGSSSTGWIEPLRDDPDGLNGDVDYINTFSFIGSQGTLNYMHEGYNNFTISSVEQNNSGRPANSNIADLVTGVDPAGPIDFSSADVVMLLIGTNGLPSSDADLNSTAANLDALIASIVGQIDANDVLLVSTLAPVAYQRKRFDTGLFPGDDENVKINSFNDKLLDAFTGSSIGADDGAYDSLIWDSGTIAEHDDFSDQVYLLDLNNAFGPTPDESLFTDDYLHLSDAGNDLLADFYTARYLELGLQAVPSPTSGATLLVLIGMGLVRRRRAA